MFETVGNEEFVSLLYAEIAAAEVRIRIQVMTFDGDSAGLGVANALIAAVERGVDVAVLVDDFALHYVSDVRVGDADVEDEYRSTIAMFRRMRDAGIGVTVTNPWGPLRMFAPIRNHKKIFVIDEVGYLGGINISDHNFEWRDFNVRLTDTSVVDALVADFDRTRRGEMVAVDGPILTNEHLQKRFDGLIAGASESVVIASPYALDVELVRSLERCNAASRILISPHTSNLALYRTTDRYLRHRLARSGVELATYPDFFHAKFALFDDRCLLVGSANFDQHSFTCNREIGLLITDPAFIANFKSIMMQGVTELDERPSLPGIVAGAITAHALAIAIRLLALLVAPRVRPIAPLEDVLNRIRMGS